jgi:integrase/recombinase XerD
MHSPRQNYLRLSEIANRAESCVGGQSKWRSALARMEGAYSANTIRSYRADFTIFEVWCRQEHRSALPATPKTVADFVLAQSKNAAPATVSRRRAAIAKIHRLLRLHSPVRTEEVNLATRTVFRQKGRRQDQALGLTSALKQKLIAACPADLRGLRDRALIAVGYDTLCRRSELVQLRIEDLTIKPDGSGTVLVRKSKADQFGDGRLAYLSPEALAHMQRWLRAADLKTGPIFRGIRGAQLMPDALHPYSVARIPKDRARGAGLDRTLVAKLSGHSMRVGAAQDMAAAGIDLGAIMHAGGWKSPDMVMRYIEHMDVQKSGMARLYGAARPS